MSGIIILVNINVFVLVYLFGGKYIMVIFNRGNFLFSGKRIGMEIKSRDLGRFCWSCVVLGLVGSWVVRLGCCR